MKDGFGIRITEMIFFFGFLFESYELNSQILHRQ